MIFKNKGEWNELYVCFKFLADGKMYNADAYGVKTGEYLEITKIFREDDEGVKTYIRDVDNRVVKIYLNGNLEKEIDFDVFNDMAECLFVNLKLARKRPEIQDLLAQNPSNKQGFPIPEVETFMSEILMTTVSQSAAHKADIEFEIKDVHTGSQNRVAYSIKSNFKSSKATLINASEATNFVYKLHSMNDVHMDNINSINTTNKIIDRIQYMRDNVIQMEFRTTYRPLAKQNLRRVDSLLPEIISELLKIHYITGKTSVKEVVELLTQKDPFKFEDDYAYIYKFKKFLTACSLGLDIGKTWNGLEEATGGMIIVQDDGEIIAFHLYDRNLFEEFLFNSVKFERASTSRHKFASVYKVDDKYFFNLNLQIRYF